MVTKNLSKENPYFMTGSLSNFCGTDVGNQPISLKKQSLELNEFLKDELIKKKAPIIIHVVLY